MILQKGEVRQVGIEVINKLGQDFEIDVAEFSVIDSKSELVESGFPTIKDKKIFMLFNAESIGTFYVVFKYHIESEIIKAKVAIKVN